MNAVVVLPPSSSSSQDDNTCSNNKADDSRRMTTAPNSGGIKESNIVVHKKKGFLLHGAKDSSNAAQRKGGHHHHTAPSDNMKEEASCGETDLETESETSKEDNDYAQNDMGLGLSSTSSTEAEMFDNKTRGKGVSFAVNIDGSVQCQTRIIKRVDKEDCWYTPEEKDAMTESFSRVVKFYQLSSSSSSRNHVGDEKDEQCDVKAYVHALTRLQKESHKMSMQQACQHLATLGLHANHTRGLESYVICDIFDYLRQKHLVRILMAQNQMEEKYGMHYERQGGGDDDVENVIIKELSRTSLRWSVRSSQYARLIALLDKHAAKEALASPWVEEKDEKKVEETTTGTSSSSNHKQQRQEKGAGSSNDA